MHKIKKQNLLAAFVAMFMAVSIVLVSTSSSLFAATTTPATINYQGRLLDSSSNPLAGSYTFRFSLWNTADWVAGDTTGAGAINAAAPGYAGWQETHAVTTGTYGLFNMSLGSVTGFPNFADPTHTHLQVEVKATGSADTTYEILDPAGTTADANDRKPLHKSAFAENADTLDNAEVGTTAGDIAVLTAGGDWDEAQIPGGTDADTFTIDDDGGAAGDVVLEFGTTLAKTLKYSQASSWFEFNDDVSFAKNQIKNVAIDNLAGAPGAPVAGQIYHNTTDGNSYIWNGGAWEDITAGAAVGTDLDTAYNTGQSITVDGSGDLVFNLNNTEDFVIQDAGSPFATFTDTGEFQLDNLQLDGNTLSSTNVNGDITLDPNGTGDVELSAPVNVHGTILTLDSDNAGGGANVDLVANQGSDNDGTLRYNATTNQWEVSNDGGAFGKLISGTVAWADIATRAKEITLEPDYDGVVIEKDGTLNKGKLIYDFIDGGGTDKRNFYDWTTRQATQQDIDLVISLQLPNDFVSFTGTPLSINYRTSDGVTATNKVDVAMYDTAGTAVALTGASSLANAAWTTAAITFGGGETFTAGSTITLVVKLSTTSSGWTRVSDIVLNYNGK